MQEIYIQLRYIVPLQMIQIMTAILPENRFVGRFRGILSRPFILQCGRGLSLGRGVMILNSQNLKLGNDVFLARGAWLNAMGGLTLDDEVVLGPFVVISTLQHTFENYSVRNGGSKAAPVHIGRGTWVAAHCSIKCGVKIGKGNLVAANSSVIRSTPNYKVLGGVPATIIKDVENGGAQFYTRKEMNAK